MVLRDDEQAEAEAVQPVDSEGRATVLRLLAFSSPHTRAFHLSWLSLAACFFAAFASPPLLPALRPALRILPRHLSAASSAALVSALLSRLLLGPACHLLPSRLVLAAVSLLSALPLPFIAAVAASPADYVALRAVSGVSLAAFVANQHWVAAIFAPRVVGAAGAGAAGWANAGAAAAQLVMPRAFELLRGPLGFTTDAAWRLAFVVPTAFQVATALAVIFLADDDAVPGNKHKKNKKDELEGSGSFWEVLEDGVWNYRGWVLALTYGYCYGAELIMENIAARYFYEKFGLDMGAAGAAAAFFGAMNVVARPAGGMASDELGRRFGMRGRLWGLWAAQTVAGMLCILLGRMGRWSSSSVAATVAVMVVFALFVQAASGLTFGIVPFVSKRSMGVISGMTGSGGVVGAMTMQLLFFSGSKYAIETGISCMGAMIAVCTLPIALIRFPESGGMFCGPHSSSSAARDVDHGVEDEYLLLLK